MARSQSNKPANKPATEKAGAAQAASAAAEKLDNQPAATSSAAAQDGQVVVIWDGKGVAEYLVALKAGEAGVIPLQDLAEPLLRQVGQHLDIEGADALQIEQLIPLIEAKAEINDGEQSGFTPPAAGSELAAVVQAAPGATSNSVDDPAAGLNGDDIQALFIRSVSPRGFRRCGHRFTPEGHGIALSALTEEQIEALASDPNLRVEVGTFSGKAE
ncbi:hypothetical protein K8U54_12935 [Pseudomonas fulva]|uniref:hypothetical protein n=1 Tax=Pseudomonas fulva TaxID=47880 RepID=UPI00201DE615|nr:hypothetical protein [Pseudomonas fulva]UQY32649.1 hypothetical protein K8U54_12935 [Pseudomonas fulva]